MFLLQFLGIRYAGGRPRGSKIKVRLKAFEDSRMWGTLEPYRSGGDPKMPPLMYDRGAARTYTTFIQQLCTCHSFQLHTNTRCYSH